MMHTEAVETRTLTIVLPESEWRALRAQEPDAIGWLQAQIKSRLSESSSPGPGARGSAPDDVWDDY
jgi:hypothetical protein